MWKLSDETIHHLVQERHSCRRKFEFERADQIRAELEEDGWLIEDYLKSAVVRPKRGAQDVPPIHISFDEEA